MLSTVNVKYWISGFILIALSAVSFFAQQPNSSIKPVSSSKTEKTDKKDASTDDKIKAVEAAGSTVYQSGKRSPFEDPSRRPITFHKETVRLFPPVDERLTDYMSRRS